MPQTVGPVEVPVQLEQASQPALGGDDIALDLDDRDRRLQRRPILVRNPVPRVLPAVVRETAGPAAAILEQLVAVEIAELIDPAQGLVDLRLQLMEEVQ